MSTMCEDRQLIKGAATNTNIANTWFLLSAFDDVSIEIIHQSGSGNYKIGASNSYDPARNPNPTPVDLTAAITPIGGTFAVAGAARMVATVPYPCAYKAICVSYTASSGGAAAQCDVFINMKG